LEKTLHQFHEFGDVDFLKINEMGIFLLDMPAMRRPAAQKTTGLNQG